MSGLLSPHPSGRAPAAPAASSAPGSRGPVTVATPYVRSTAAARSTPGDAPSARKAVQAPPGCLDGPGGPVTPGPRQLEPAASQGIGQVELGQPLLARGQRRHSGSRVALEQSHPAVGDVGPGRDVRSPGQVGESAQRRGVPTGGGAIVRRAGRGPQQLQRLGPMAGLEGCGGSRSMTRSGRPWASASSAAAAAPRLDRQRCPDLLGVLQAGPTADPQSRQPSPTLAPKCRGSGGCRPRCSCSPPSSHRPGRAAGCRTPAGTPRPTTDSRSGDEPVCQPGPVDDPVRVPGDLAGGDQVAADVDHRVQPGRLTGQGGGDRLLQQREAGVVASLDPDPTELGQRHQLQISVAELAGTGVGVAGEVLREVEIGEPVAAGDLDPAVQRTDRLGRQQPFGPSGPAVGGQVVVVVRPVHDRQPHRRLGTAGQVEPAGENSGTPRPRARRPGRARRATTVPRPGPGGSARARTARRARR